MERIMLFGKDKNSLAKYSWRLRLRRAFFCFGILIERFHSSQFEGSTVVKRDAIVEIIKESLQYEDDWIRNRNIETEIRNQRSAKKWERIQKWFFNSFNNVGDRKFTTNSLLINLIEIKRNKRKKWIIEIIKLSFIQR